MVKDSHSSIPQVEEKKKQYTACDLKRGDCAILFQNIAIQPVKKILHAVNNNIFHHFPILQ